MLLKYLMIYSMTTKQAIKIEHYLIYFDSYFWRCNDMKMLLRQNNNTFLSLSDFDKNEKQYTKISYLRPESDTNKIASDLWSKTRK